MLKLALIALFVATMGTLTIAASGMPVETAVAAQTVLG
jgi:hypothetical protein